MVTLVHTAKVKTFGRSRANVPGCILGIWVAVFWGREGDRVSRCGGHVYRFRNSQASFASPALVALGDSLTRGWGAGGSPVEFVSARARPSRQEARGT